MDLDPQQISFGPGYPPGGGGYGPPGGGGYGGPPGGGGFGGPPGGGGFGGPPGGGGGGYGGPPGGGGGGFGGPPPGGFGPPGGYGPPPGGFGGPPPDGFGGPPGYPGGGGMMGPAPSSGLAIGALVCGILAIPGACCCYSGIPIGIAGGVMGFIAMSKAKQSPETHGGRGMAMAGMICGIIGAVLTILLFAFGMSMSMLDQLNRH